MAFVSAAHRQRIIMSYHAIDSFDESDKNKKTKSDQRSLNERKNFQNEFQELNKLFNDALELPDDTPIPPNPSTIPIDTSKQSKSTQTPKNNDRLDMEHSYANQITKLKEKLNRQNIIKSDKTGRAAKAAGED